MQCLTAELKGVSIRGWNYELPFFIAAVIFPMIEIFRSSKDIHTRIERRMELWNQRPVSALVDDTINAGQRKKGGPSQEGSTTVQEELAVQAYNCTFLSGIIRQAVQRATIWEGRGGALTKRHLYQDRAVGH